MRPWALCSFVAVATIACVSLTIGWHLHMSDLEGSSPRPSMARSISFTLDLVAFDPLQDTATLDWWIIEDNCTDSVAAGAAPASLCSVVNIYVNPCVL